MDCWISLAGWSNWLPADEFSAPVMTKDASIECIKQPLDMINLVYEALPRLLMPFTGTTKTFETIGTTFAITQNEWTEVATGCCILTRQSVHIQEQLKWVTYLSKNTGDRRREKKTTKFVRFVKYKLYRWTTNIPANNAHFCSYTFNV